MTDDVRREQIPWQAEPRLPLGRSLEHDPRSRGFRIPRQAEPLRSVRWARKVPIYDQGASFVYQGERYDGLGSCTCQAWAGVLSTSPNHYRIKSQSTIRRFYRDTTANDEFDGTWPPDDTGSSGLSAAKAYARKGYLPNGYVHAFGITDLVHMLQRGPASIGTWWLYSMFTPDATGRMRVDYNSGRAGGHQYEVSAYEMIGTTINGDDRLWIPNSWGEGWGQRGYAYMLLRDVDTLLADQGDAIAPAPAAA